ncbi:indole-3-glycerol phosphate synthase TrpC [Sphingomonas jatrophae]|uniref:Indole-3-glycerol phosphate synthase n=1 Tax=Sphingomonas jatrophae TaxID=1166337 RepID=A0A1I6JDM6_9SPHN|nr:indole-3-glycerol phosphate synthase TrpC [Sphingomonas jatrophae]SFR77042.1 indole-3-glycerol phosphate synthase [Sphingomonas jatrophae]
MTDRLAEICATKREHVATRKAVIRPAEIDRMARAAFPARGFHAALREKAKAGTALIAEIKKASPSKGLIRADFDPAAHARAYQAGGAACLSILTDEPYFQGSDDYLVAARIEVSLPCLRKDFMVDPWQSAEARALGADAILVIMAALDDGLVHEIEAAALDHGMDVLIEVHDEAELERALRLRSRLIGVNNRDLRDFSVDLGRTERLAALVPGDVTLVAESGIRDAADLARLHAAGIRCALVGETLMREPDLEAATRRLLA